MSMWVACGDEQLSWWDTEFFSKCEELLLLRSDKRRCLQEQLVFADAPASIEEVAHLDASLRPSFLGSIGFYYSILQRRLTLPAPWQSCRRQPKRRRRRCAV